MHESGSVNKDGVERWDSAKTHPDVPVDPVEMAARNDARKANKKAQEHLQNANGQGVVDRSSVHIPKKKLTWSVISNPFVNAKKWVSDLIENVRNYLKRDGNEQVQSPSISTWKRGEKPSKTAQLKAMETKIEVLENEFKNKLDDFEKKINEMSDENLETATKKDEESKAMEKEVVELENKINKLKEELGQFKQSNETELLREKVIERSIAEPSTVTAAVYNPDQEKAIERCIEVINGMIAEQSTLTAAVNQPEAAAVNKPEPKMILGRILIKALWEEKPLNLREKNIVQFISITSTKDKKNVEEMVFKMAKEGLAELETLDDGDNLDRWDERMKDMIGKFSPDKKVFMRNFLKHLDENPNLRNKFANQFISIEGGVNMNVQGYDNALYRLYRL